MLEMREAEILRIAEQYVLYKIEVDDNGLFWLFDIQEGACFKLNETTFFILSCFDGKASLSEIRQQVLSRYHNEDPKSILNDFDEIVNILKKQKVLSVVRQEDNKHEK